jgi:hypothetical protein
MKRGGQGQEKISDKVKEKPGRDQSQQELAEVQRARETAPFEERHARQFSQARGANDPVLMLGDTFAAKVLGALRAARGCFALGMVEAALISQRLHY